MTPDPVPEPVERPSPEPVPPPPEPVPPFPEPHPSLPEPVEGPSRWEDLVFDGDGRLVDTGGALEFARFGAPPPVTWTPVMDLAEVFGRRAAVVNSRGPIYDLRLASEAFEDAGGWYVHLVGEDQWWDWLAVTPAERPTRPGRAVCWPTRYVWVETRGRS